MYTILLILIGLWIISRITDAFSCIVLAFSVKNKKIYSALIPAYKMFIALAIDAAATTLLIVLLVPYLVLAWNPPPSWTLPWLGCAAISSSGYKSYTKFKVAYLLLTKGE